MIGASFQGFQNFRFRLIKPRPFQLRWLRNYTYSLKKISTSCGLLFIQQKNPDGNARFTESLALTVQKMAQAQKFVHFAPKEFLNHVGTQYNVHYTNNILIQGHSSSFCWLSRKATFLHILNHLLCIPLTRGGKFTVWSKKFQGRNLNIHAFTILRNNSTTFLK